MATVVELPRLSDTMEEGVVATWRVSLGDKVKRGQVIAEIETDKATMEFESFDAGFVLALVAEEGQTLPVGAALAVLGKQGEDPAAKLAEFGAAAAPTPAPAATEAPRATPASPAAAPATPAAAATTPLVEAAVALVDDTGSERIPASPLARRLAREHGLALASIPGSGPHGRVIKTDVEQAAIRGPGSGLSTSAGAGALSTELDAWGRPYAARPDGIVKLTQMRKIIARRMTQAKQEIPHYYLTVDVDMERATSFRAELNAVLDGSKISYNDLVVKAVARALRDFPAMNSRFEGDHYVRLGDVHVGVAVALEDGLVVPVIRHADQKSLEAISRETRDMGRRAKKKQLRPDEMSGGTFSVSNLGMFGIQEFSAVVNPGEAGILAVAAIEPRPVVMDGELVIRRRMKITISADHRISDGAVGAKWLGAVRTYLENPIKMLTDPVVERS